MGLRETLEAATRATLSEREGVRAGSVKHSGGRSQVGVELLGRQRQTRTSGLIAGRRIVVALSRSLRVVLLARLDRIGKETTNG